MSFVRPPMPGRGWLGQSALPPPAAELWLCVLTEPLSLVTAANVGHLP